MGSFVHSFLPLSQIIVCKLYFFVETIFLNFKKLVIFVLLTVPIEFFAGSYEINATLAFLLSQFCLIDFNSRDTKSTNRAPEKMKPLF